jgi:putative SOS response-associated peptidase YedK
MIVADAPVVKIGAFGSPLLVDAQPLARTAAPSNEAAKANRERMGTPLAWWADHPGSWGCKNRAAGAVRPDLATRPAASERLCARAADRLPSRGGQRISLFRSGGSQHATDPLASLAGTVCGRLFLSIPGPDLARQFELADVPADITRFNVAPGQTLPLVRAALDAEPGAGRALIHPRWGLVPAWARDPNRGRRPINARAETVATSPMFRAALGRRRGLVPASGFYEWQHAGRSSRPFAIVPRAGGLLALAAIFERWDRDGSVLETCALLTTAADEPVRSIHDRMPVCVPVAGYATWLDPSLRDGQVLESVLSAGSAPPLETYPISERVNHVREDDAGLLEPARDLFSAGGSP